MQFNGETDDNDLCTFADDLVGTTDTDFPLKQKAKFANWGLRDIFKEILKVYGGWSIQDSNVSGTDEAKTNLLNDGTQFYAFATVASIRGVEFEDENGNKTPLKPITLEQIREMGYAEDEFCSSSGSPEYYRPLKNGIKIYPAWYTSKASVSNGLIVKIAAQDISPFAYDDTNVSPGYDSLAGHEAVAIFMAMKFAEINTLDSFKGLYDSWLTALLGVKSFYADKFKEFKQSLNVKRNRESIMSQFE